MYNNDFDKYFDESNKAKSVVVSSNAKAALNTNDIETQVSEVENEKFVPVEGYSTYTEYIDENVIVNISGDKRITNFNEQVSVQGESDAQYIVFEMNRYCEGIDLGEKRIQIHYERPDGLGDNSPPVNVEMSDKRIRFGWIVPAMATEVNGRLKVMPFVYGNSPVTGSDIYIMKTLYAEYEIRNGLSIDGGIKKNDEWYNQFLIDMLNYVSEAREYALESLDSAEFVKTEKEEIDKIRIHIVELVEQIKTIDYDISEIYSIKNEVKQSENTVLGYVEEVKKIVGSIGGVLIIYGTIKFEELPNDAIVGATYNISNDFITDERFIEGPGHKHKLGTNVCYTNIGKWDVLAGALPTKDDLGLNKVENKSSEEIRGELTEKNVTDALGYKPQEKDTNTTYEIMKGATESTDGSSGLVPYPLKGNNNRYLRSDGKWEVPLNDDTKYSLPLAANGVRGGIQLGFNQNGQKYPVQVEGEKAYVDVPWTDTVVTKSSLGLGNVDNTADANKDVLSAKYLKGTYVALSGKKLSEFRSMLDSIANYSGANFSTLSSIRANAGNLITVWNNNDENTAFNAGVSHTFTLIATYIDSNYQAWLVSTYTENQNYIVIKSNGDWGQINKIGLEKNFPKVPTIPSSLKNPYSLKFTGAVKKEYDGSAEVTVEIPEGNNVTYDKVTQSTDGLMSSEDKVKLDKFGDGYVTAGKKQGTKLGINATAEGEDVAASGDYSHAEGYNTNAVVKYSHTEGYYTNAQSQATHAEGYYTNAANFGGHAGGQYNKDMVASLGPGIKSGDAFVIGNGTGDSAANRSNAFRVDYVGNVYGVKAYTTGGADYSEFIYEWFDGNIDGEDRVGYFVTVREKKIYKANEGDYIVGITSGNPSIVGNGDEDYYWRWERDEFNRIIMVDVPELVEKKDENGNVVIDKNTGFPIMEKTGRIIKNGDFKQNLDYDASNKYVERKDRPEWDYIGMLGVLPVRDDGTCKVDEYCKCGNGGIATYAKERDFDTFRVIERVNDNVVKVVLK